MIYFLNISWIFPDFYEFFNNSSNLHEVGRDLTSWRKLHEESFKIFSIIVHEQFFKVWNILDLMHFVSQGMIHLMQLSVHINRSGVTIIPVTTVHRFVLVRNLHISVISENDQRGFLLKINDDTAPGGFKTCWPCLLLSCCRYLALGVRIYCMWENGCCVNPMSLFLNIMQFNIDNLSMKLLIYASRFIYANQQGTMKQISEDSRY